MVLIIVRRVGVTVSNRSMQNLLIEDQKIHCYKFKLFLLKNRDLDFCFEQLNL